MKTAAQSFFFLSIIVLLSCSNPFAPALVSDAPRHSRLIAQQTAPDSVLKNFRYAYTFKDSLVYAELLDTSFIFISTDFNQYPPTPLEWGRDTELRTAGRMFRFFSTLDVVWNTISAPVVVQDTPAVKIEHKITFTLTLDGGRTIPPLNGEVIFQFVKREVVEQGKKSYKFFICRWQDQKI